MDEVVNRSSTVRRVTERWTVDQALAWIAYRVDPTMLPPAEYPAIGKHNISEIMGALKARVDHNPRLWPPNGGPIFSPRDGTPILAYPFRWSMKHWMRETRLSAPALLDKAQADLERYETAKLDCEKRERLFNYALCELCEAAREGWIIVRARPSKTAEKPPSPKPREVVPSNVFCEFRGIDSEGWVRIPFPKTSNFEKLLNAYNQDPGPFYYDVELDAAQVQDVWPKKERPAVTSGGEKQLQTWLERQMLASPGRSPGKKEMRRRAKEEGLIFSGEGFSRAWSNAIATTGAVSWSRPGAKSKGSIE